MGVSANVCVLAGVTGPVDGSDVSEVGSRCGSTETTGLA